MSNEVDTGGMSVSSVVTGGGTLNVAAGKTLTVNNSETIAGTDGKTLTLTNGLTVSGNDGTLSFGAASKTLTVNNSLTLAGTDATTMTFPSTSQTIAAKPVWQETLPTNPAGTSSTTGVMMGLAGSITPTVTGRLFFIATGYVFNNTINDGAKFQLFTGTGTAPTNGAAITGTGRGIGALQMSGAAANQVIPFTLIGAAGGFTLGTAVWIDIMLGAITGGTATINNVTIEAWEF